MGQRRRRLSDQESAERMIAAAMEMIRESGLTVSLDHISIEDVVRRADVSRTAAYRRWKYKDDFFADLLRELAHDPHPAATADHARPEELRALVADHLDWVETAEGRARLYAEVLRLTGARDLTMLATSHRWRSYISLQAAVLSQQESDFRTELQGILAESERRIQRRTAANYAVLAEVFGRRIRPDAAVTFEHIAIMHDSVVNGVALKALTDPGLLTLTIGAPPVAASSVPWSIPAAIAFAIEHLYTEPDPAVTWDGQRIAAIQGFLRRAADFTATGDLTLIQSEDGLRQLPNA
jgi:AcrR family transcriptional regulator